MTTETNIDFADYTITKTGRNSHWTRIGAAWSHKDDEGINIVLNAIPVNCEIVLRRPKDEDDHSVKRDD